LIYKVSLFCLSLSWTQSLSACCSSVQYCTIICKWVLWAKCRYSPVCVAFNIP